MAEAATVETPIKAEPTLVSSETEFWFVWGKNARVPKHVHPTEESAVREAERLAKLNPGKRFVVLRASREVYAIPEIEPSVAVAAQ